MWFFLHEDIQQGKVVSEITFFGWACQACSRPSFGTTNALNLVPWVLEKMFSLEMVKNDISLAGAGKLNAIFLKRCVKPMTRYN